VLDIVIERDFIRSFEGWMYDRDCFVKDEADQWQV
jgi:hypothetical protein